MQTAEKEPGQAEIFKSGDRLLDFDLSEELNHGIAVSNLAYAVAAELGRTRSSVIRWRLPECSMILGS